MRLSGQPGEMEKRMGLILWYPKIQWFFRCETCSQGDGKGVALTQEGDQSVWDWMGLSRQLEKKCIKRREQYEVLLKGQVREDYQIWEHGSYVRPWQEGSKQHHGERSRIWGLWENGRQERQDQTSPSQSLALKTLALKSSKEVRVLSGGRCGNNERDLGFCFLFKIWDSGTGLYANKNYLIERKMLMMKKLETKVCETRGDREYKIRVIVNKSVTKNLFWKGSKLSHYSGL